MRVEDPLILVIAFVDLGKVRFEVIYDGIELHWAVSIGSDAETR